MKYILGILIRLLLIPIFILIIILGIIEILTIICSVYLIVYFYEWLFHIDYTNKRNKYILATGLLWEKLSNFSNKF